MTDKFAQYQPKVITTESENEAAIALAEKLEHRPNRTPEENALLELLVTLIEKFEEHYPIPEGNPHSMLLHLMEAQDVKQEALVGVIGSRGVVLEVVNGKRSISKAQAKAHKRVLSCIARTVFIRDDVLVPKNCLSRGN